ncbi:lipoxygenase family protein [Microcoleus sp. F10-C6]|uniref:lipoxygenase family protein n=1 Tax=unclassified Microcoleus TaxID=2642155 RepID=UPI002FD4534E
MKNLIKEISKVTDPACFDRNPDVEVLGILQAPIHQVWKIFRPFGKDNLEWWKIYETMDILPPGKDKVGSIRRFKLSVQHSTFDELLVARDDEKFSERYDFVQVEPQIPGLKTISTFVEFSPLVDSMTGKETLTKVRWFSYTEASPPQVKEALMNVQHNAYTDAIKYLNSALNLIGESQTMSLPNYAEQLRHNPTSVADFIATLEKILKQVLTDVVVEQQEKWEYQTYEKNAELPDVDLTRLPRAVKGLPRSEALDPTRAGMFFKRLNEVLYTELGIQERLAKSGDIYQAVQGGYIGETPYINENWRKDREFARHFLNGLNPMTIKVVGSIEEVPENMRDLSYKGKSLRDLLLEKRLLIVDLPELKNVKPHQGMYTYPATGLIVQDSEEGETFVDMIGIRLNDDLPVYTPQSPTNRWMLAKLHMKSADNQVMQFIWHLGFGHIGVEPFAVAFHNSFPPSVDHPIRDLLAPHFKDTIGINYVARHTLVSNVMPFTDSTFSTGTAQGLEIMLNAWLKWDFEKSSFPQQLSERGFDREQSEGIQDYYYREDGFKLWDIFGEYTTDFVNAAYPNDDDVATDAMIKGWVTEMRDPNKADIPSFPENISSKKQLAWVLQNIIWKTSAGHAILNFAQFDYGAYLPNYPIAMLAPMPEGEDEISDEYVKAALPHTIKRILFQLTSAYLLTDASRFRLAGPLAIAPLEKRFPEVQHRANLRFTALSRDIKVRNMKLQDAGKLPYPYLDPENVPPSIDI